VSLFWKKKFREILRNKVAQSATVQPTQPAAVGSAVVQPAAANEKPANENPKFFGKSSSEQPAIGNSNTVEQPAIGNTVEQPSIGSAKQPSIASADQPSVGPFGPDFTADTIMTDVRITSGLLAGGIGGSSLGRGLGLGGSAQYHGNTNTIGNTDITMSDGNTVGGNMFNKPSTTTAGNNNNIGSIFKPTSGGPNPFALTKGPNLSRAPNPSKVSAASEPEPAVPAVGPFPQAKEHQIQINSTRNIKVGEMGEMISWIDDYDSECIDDLSGIRCITIT
jgi:hypothetical protein